jgi:DNA replication protein DnaC
MYADDPIIIAAMPGGRYLRHEMTEPFSPEKYGQAIKAAASEGVTALVIDSATHEWEGLGGCKDIAEKNKLRGLPNWALAEIRVSDCWHTPKCPSCEMEALAAQEAADAARKKLVEAQSSHVRLAQRLKRADIPPRFADRSFDMFRAETEEQRRALAIAEAYAENFVEIRKKGQSMILFGKIGTGKTHLACAILNYAAHHCGAEARYLSFAKAIRSVKQTYAKGNAMTEQQALDALAVPDLLVLDEVGVQFGSEAEKIIGFEIVNTRYEAMKPTIIISNLTMPELRECLGDRVIDRLRESGGKAVEFAGDSQRGKQAT